MQLRIWIITILLAAGVAACTPRDVPTPQQTTETELVELVPVTVERILPTATPAPTNTLEPTQTTIPTQTASPIPPTSTATSTPSFRLPANVEITNVVLSSKGQLAYIRDEILYAEIEPQTREFEEIGRFALAAAWSPDGSQLAYSTESIPNAELDDPDQIYDLRLWAPSDSSDVSFNDLVSNFPDPALQIDELHWTPDGTKILIHVPLTPEEIETYNYTFKGEFSKVDLNLKIWGGNQLVSSNHHVLWLTDDVYILRFHCGSPCADISAYDYSGNLAWTPYWDTGGFVEFAPDGNFMINVGRIDTNSTDNIPTEPYLPTLDKIDLTSGDIEVLWELPVRENYFTAFLMPSISPDEQLFTFNWGGLETAPEKLYIVNQNGDQIGQYEKSYALDWRNNDDLAVKKILETGENQLLLVSANGNEKPLFTTTPDIEIVGGIWTPTSTSGWSPNGQYFLFVTESSNHKNTQVYIWNSETEESKLIHALDNVRYFQNVNWLPDSTGVYFTSGQYGAIWFYDIESEELELAVPQLD
jgi:Tol biopolymer transport system component